MDNDLDDDSISGTLTAGDDSSSEGCDVQAACRTFLETHARLARLVGEATPPSAGCAKLNVAPLIGNRQRPATPVEPRRIVTGWRLTRDETRSAGRAGRRKKMGNIDDDFRA